MSHGSDKQAWILTLASSIACIVGSLFICLDLLVRLLPGQHEFSLEDNRFLVGGLSLGAGVLLFTALNKMLPEAMTYLMVEDDTGKTLLSDKSAATAVLMTSFLAGVVLCIMLNSLLHRLTPESIVHCGQDHDHASDEEQDTPAPQRQMSERTPLMRSSVSRATLRSHASYRKCRHEGDSECAGFTDPCAQESACCSHPKDSPNEGEASHHNHERTSDDHHHHVTEERHNLMRIGLQTAIAISLHKLPEGAITFMSSHRDSSLGFSIFLALGIHNFVEGFTIAFPLYLAFRSRVKAILAAIVLGGLSQPLGALIAFGVTQINSGHLKTDSHLDLVYGILFGVTAGFMAVIAVSSMLPQAFRNDTPTATLTSTCFFIGIAIIGYSNALTAH